MRKLVNIFILTVFVSTLAFGQYEPKGKVSKAESALSSEELNEAKAEIDLAFEVDKKGKVTSNAKNWYVRGNVYKAIYQKNSELAENPLQTAVESYQKAIEIEDKENGFYTIACNQELANLYNSAIDAGAKAYEAENYEEAFKQFKKASKVMENDSIALLYAGTAAQVAEMTDEAIEMYDQLVETGNAGESVYSSLIYIYKVQKEDMETALDYINKGLEVYPGNETFIQEKIVYLITSGRSEEAEQELLKEIKSKPEDPLLRFQLGYLYDEWDKDDKALEAYGKAVELDPDYYDAIFNYAAIYYNKAADVLSELNNMSMKEFQKNEKAYSEKAKGYFEKALPYLEKAYTLDSTDVKLLEILGSIYTRLGMKEKAAEMQSQLEAVDSGE